ncbi:hemicentin-1-like [Toxotes jaculatrix]|uniref:hemicentin-1-like n=1 Tax=Toxotes jaculatrix TaxID=941984 RepID=UPI001B3B1865|nr:hemicentin-1-like [Toxotes jaculatrix]
MEKKGEGTSAIVLLALIQNFLASGAVEVQPSSNPAIVGDTVTLSLSPSVTLKSGSWAVGESLIIIWTERQQVVLPSYSDRASIEVLTGALTLNSVTLADSGVYVVQSNDPKLSANTSITVLEPISNITLKTNQTDLMEFNSSAVITCSVSSGSSLSFLWLNGSSEVTASERVQLTDGNSTLTVVNVTRYDHGPFRCCVFNPISNGTSDPVNLTISYGPDSMALTVNGQNTTYFLVGSNLTMICSAQSNPPALLQWTFSGESVNTTGPLLELYSISEDQSGPYSCLAFNNHTNMRSNITSHVMITNHVCSQRIYASENPLPVGSNVTLSSQVNVTLGVWMFDNNVIVWIMQGVVTITEEWRDRVTFSSANSSLTIRSLQVGDSGVYTLQLVNSYRAKLILSVQVPISNVTLMAKATQLVEYNDTAVLVCSVSSGSFPSYVWLKNNSVLTAGGEVQLSNGNATLSIVNVTHYDKGPFMCNVSNGVSYEISPPVYLNISYGPSNTTMMIMPMAPKYMYRTGSDITLSCSAMSSPSAMITWMVDGVYLNKYGPKIQLNNATKNESGNYKCVFYNNVTSRFSSASTMLWILDPLHSAEVNSTGPAILHNPFTLHCEVTGPVERIQWWKDSWLISPDNTTLFEMDNKTLILNPLQHSDNGDYMCQAFNSVSNITSSPYKVAVKYGPEMLNIIGPAAAKTGSSVTFTCRALSYPPSLYTWSFSGNQVANTSEYVTPPLTKEMSGLYTCTAYNEMTGQNKTANTTLTVVDPIEDVQVESPMSPPKEGYPYMLTCNVTGPADHVYWLKDDMELYEDNRTVFNMYNSTVTINALNRNDTGYYKCTAVNAVGSMTSPTYKLLVNFGPDTPVIYGPRFGEMGQNTTFSCSAMSVPPSQFSWWFNGTEVANTSVFTNGPLSLNMSGEYTCMAYNYVTEKNSTNSKMFTVIEAIESVMIKSSTVPIKDQSFTLICEVAGPYEMIYWMKNNMHLNMNTATYPDMHNHTGNNTLHFTSLTMYDDGTYQCVAINQAGRHESPQYTLLVNYGPLNVIITGPGSEKPGQNVSLKCSADSRPDCEFSWFLNSTTSDPKAIGPVITFHATKEKAGLYICKARNAVTDITEYQRTTFTVIGPLSLSGHASVIHFPSQGSLTVMGLIALFVPVLFN